MRCGRYNRSFAFNSEGELFILYLHVAHVFPGEKQNPDAYLIVLCPTCHRRYDKPRKSGAEGIADWSFIGEVARIFIEQESREYEQDRIKEQVDLAQYVASCIQQHTDNRTGEKNGNSDAG